MSDKEKFCRSFEWNIDIGWFDLTGYTPIGESRRAKIELTGSSKPASFTVTIINRIEGMVDKKKFSFDDYLDRSMEARKDQRSDYPLGGNPCFHAWKSGSKDLEWYIAIPKTTRPICEAIEKYIGVFR